MNLFLPDLSVDSYRDLDPVSLYASGIRLIFCDIDNTLSKLGDTRCHRDVIRFLFSLHNAGIEPVLFTNNTKRHAARVMKGKPPFAMKTFVCKPFPFSLWNVMQTRHLRPHECAVFGDQLFTDILGGNLAGCRTILSAPLSSQERNDTKFMRLLENRVYADLERKGKLKREGQHVRIL